MRYLTRENDNKKDVILKQTENLIATLALCIPQLDTTPLRANPPASTEQHALLAWLYQHLSEQNLMVYREWGEYTGDIPALTPLAGLSFPENPADFIYSLLEEIDWSTASIDPAEVPYVMPWLEHINFYLAQSDLRLTDLLPFENAYMLCVRNDEALLEKLNAALEAFGMGVNERSAMGREQVADEIASLI